MYVSTIGANFFYNLLVRIVKLMKFSGRVRVIDVKAAREENKTLYSEDARLSNI